jgi:hypothetical protein
LARPGESQEGDFIVIHDARLLLPTYALLLAKAAHSARIYAPGQPDVPGRQVAHLVTTEKKEVAHYLDGLGKDPRLPATVWALERGQSKPRYSFLVPLRYSKLSDSPSLMSGNVTILGKVVRRVFPPDPRTTTETFRDDSYFDIETATRYNAALKPRSPAFLRALGLSGKATGADGGELKPRSIVNWTARVNSPGMLVIPIAMYD